LKRGVEMREEEGREGGRIERRRLIKTLTTLSENQSPPSLSQVTLGQSSSWNRFLNVTKRRNGSHKTHFVTTDEMPEGR
jgi:hypothetical protein